MNFKNIFPKKQQEQEFNNPYDKFLLESFNEKTRKGKMLFGLSLLKRSLFNKFIFIVIILLIPVVVVKIIIASPNYSYDETVISEKVFYNKVVIKSGALQTKMLSSLKYLKKYPKYYRKVVNNFIGISFVDGTDCPYMCAGGQKILYVNKKAVTYYAGETDYEFASSLVHEADHVEYYIRSGDARKKLLNIFCSPFLNFNISATSKLDDLKHRIDVVEICAEKEQLRFHKATMQDGKSWLSGDGLLVGFSKNIMRTIVFLVNFVKDIF